ncbi:hypothetical protein GGX14DRAFT_325136, partial [Mycena pura]
VTYDINIPYRDSDMEKPTINNPQYAPTWKPVWFDPLPEFDFTDPALRADKRKPHLLTPATVMENITPKMGTILRGVNLAYLSDEAKNELALLISERKIVALPKQDDFVAAGPAVKR